MTSNDFAKQSFDNQVTDISGPAQSDIVGLSSQIREDYALKMLKSTYKPSGLVGAIAPLPAGWTEHKAPTGQLCAISTTVSIQHHTTELYIGKW